MSVFIIKVDNALVHKKNLFLFEVTKIISPKRITRDESIYLYLSY